MTPALNPPAPTYERSGGKSTPAETTFVAYDIPPELKNLAQIYFRTTGTRSMADDRGRRYVVQSSRAWHDHFAALLKATPEWREPAAANERAKAPVVMKKVGNEDILEWRSVGLTFKPNGQPRASRPASEANVAVSEVAPGSPAAWADIRPGDVLTDIGSFNARSVPEVQSLLKALGEGLQSKKEVRVMFVRETSSRRSTVVADFTIGPEDLGAKPSEPQASKPRAEPPSTPVPAPIEPQAKLPPKSLSEQPYFLQFFYTRDDKGLEQAKKFTEQAEELKRKLPIGIAYMPIGKEWPPSELANLKVEHLPSYVLFYNGKQVLVIPGMQSTVQLLSAIGEAKKSSDSEPQATKPPVRAMTPAEIDKAGLRYDCKTFGQWQNAWQTELSTEKRIEAVKALAAFGRAGYGKEASEAILDVAGEYNFETETGEKLQQTVLEQLAPESRPQVMAKYWVPEVATRLQKDPKKWEWLAGNLLDRLETDDEAAISILKPLAQNGPSEIRSDALSALVRSVRSRTGGPLDKTTQELVNRKLESKNNDDIHIAISLLLNYTPSPVTKAPESHLVFQPELVPLLFHKDAEIRRQARGALRYIEEKDAQSVVKQLIATLHDKSRQRDHIEAIRALAAMGKHAKEAVPELVTLLKATQDTDILVAAYVAIGSCEEVQSYSDALRKYLSDEEIRALDKKIEKTPHDEWNAKVAREKRDLVPPASSGGGRGGGLF